VLGGAVVTVDLEVAIHLLLHDSNRDVIEMAGRLDTANGVVIDVGVGLVGVGRHRDG